MKKPYSEYAINLYIDKDLRDRLEAYILHKQLRGNSTAVKQFIREGIDRYLNDLAPKDRKIFDEILYNVSLGSNYSTKWKRPRRNPYIKKKDRHPGGV